MKRSLALAALCVFDGRELRRNRPSRIVAGLRNPESVCVGAGTGAKIFVTTIGEFDKDGDGAVMVVEPGGKAEPFVTGLDDPKGIAVLPEVALPHRQDEGDSHRRDREVAEGRGLRGRGQVPRSANLPERRLRRSGNGGDLRQRLWQGWQGRGGLSRSSQDRRGDARRR